MKRELTWKQFNSDLQTTNDNSMTVNYCNTMSYIQLIVDTVQIHQRPDQSQITSCCKTTLMIIHE